jgi:thiosulfate dehydrogenase
MKCIRLMTMLIVGMSIASNRISAAELVTIDLTQWKPPDISTAGEDPFGRLVKYGHALFSNTANEIGPAVPDPAKRFAGNNLTCQNCHGRRSVERIMTYRF